MHWLLVIWNWGLIFPVTSKCPTSVSRIDILLLRYTRIFCCNANSISVTRKRFSQVTALQELRGQWKTARLIKFPWKRSFHFSLHPKRQQRGLKIPRLERNAKLTVRLRCIPPLYRWPTKRSQKVMVKCEVTLNRIATKGVFTWYWYEFHSGTSSSRFLLIALYLFTWYRWKISYQYRTNTERYIKTLDELVPEWNSYRYHVNTP